MRDLQRQVQYFRAIGAWGMAEALEAIVLAYASSERPAQPAAHSPVSFQDASSEPRSRLQKSSPTPPATLRVNRMFSFSRILTTFKILLGMAVILVAQNFHAEPAMFYLNRAVRGVPVVCLPTTAPDLTECLIAQYTIDLEHGYKGE